MTTYVPYSDIRDQDEIESCKRCGGVLQWYGVEKVGNLKLPCYVCLNCETHWFTLGVDYTNLKK